MVRSVAVFAVFVCIDSVLWQHQYRDHSQPHRPPCSGKNGAVARKADRCPSVVGG